MHAFFHIRTVIIPQPISITHSLVCVCVCEINCVLFNSMLKYVNSMLKYVNSMLKYVNSMLKFVNSMLKYVINRLMHAFFHIWTVVIPRPISTLGLKPSG